MQFDLLDTTHNHILSLETYPEFKKALQESNCQRCPLSKSRAKIVVDRGNPESKILVISERPGDNENQTGLAFVGRAGELLDRIFASIGLDSNKDLLIINVVKCLPPTERAPLGHEVEACQPYWEKQIRLVRPKVILLLGAVAYKYVSGDGREVTMEEEAGKFFTLTKFPEIRLMVLYHPAFLLRDPRKKKPMWEHIKTLRDYLVSEGLVALRSAEGRSPEGTPSGQSPIKSKE